MTWTARIAPLLPRATALRKCLHRFPEIAHEERATAARVRDWLLDEAGLAPLATGVGGTGLLYRLEGGGPGRSVLLRSELDGLPLREASGAPHSSEAAGRHHACGHDGHMVMLAGALSLLAAHPEDWSGVVYGLFQPAEETGTGALAVVADETAMAAIDEAGGVDRAFAIHNVPRRPLGEVLLRPEGTMCRASTGLRVALRGAQSHAAMPWEGNNPTLHLADLAAVAAELPARHAPAPGDEPPLCTLVHLNVGARDYGVSPGAGDLGVTLRACRTETVDAMAAALEAAAHAAADTHGLRCEVTRVDPFGATVNDAASSAIVLEAAARVRGVPSVELMDGPFSWSEDFAALSDRFGGALVGLGGGEHRYPLHHEKYDWPDELTPIGIELWLEIAREATRAGGS
jgi:amidohydrolase